MTLIAQHRIDTGYDLLSPTFRSDPYPTYADMRRNAPVYWSEQINAWLVMPYEKVMTCLHDPRISANRIVPRIQQLPAELRETFRPIERTLSMWPLMMERPQHTRLRSLINKAITPAIVRSFVPTIQRLIDELLDTAQANGGMDAIADLALPFPLYVVSEIIGAPVEARNLLKACAVDIVNFFGCPPHRYVDKGAIAMQSITDTTEYLRGVLNERRRQPRQDLISGLIAAEERGDVMSEDEILATCLMMVFAGFETTTNLVGNGLLLLLQHSDQLHALRADPALMKTAVGEMLRYESPVQRLSRMALEDFELGGHCIRAGDLMFLSAGSANRDELKFADPDTFDIRRDTRDHLAFGHSIHLCPGNTLAQLEAQMLFASLLQRVQRLRWTDGDADWQDNLSVRSLNRLNVAFD